MADVPDAPDALVERLRSASFRPDSVYRQLADDAADRIEADDQQLDAQVEMIRNQVDAYVALRARLAEAESLLRRTRGAVASKDSVWGLGGLALLAAIDAFLAGSATPPEAPQQTPLERLAAAGARSFEINRGYGEPAVWLAEVVRSEAESGFGRVGGRGPTADAALLALADAVAPTEADRP